MCSLKTIFTLSAVFLGAASVHGHKMGRFPPDIELCWETVCEHICDTSDGIYRCSCNPKYILFYDGRSCRYDGTVLNSISNGPVSHLVMSKLNSTEHGLLDHILDKHTTIEHDPDRALHSLPDGFVVRESPRSHFEAGLGVFTEKLIPSGVVIGPYAGVKVMDNKVGIESGLSYTVTKIDERSGEEIASHLTDAKYKSLSNWLRYINSPVREAEENIRSFQHKGGIYFRTVRQVLPGEELLVWYGDDYGRILGLDVEEAEEDIRHDTCNNSLCIEDDYLSSDVEYLQFKDIELCWETVCEHICNTSDGIYRCSCNPKYILYYDGRSCRYNGTKLNIESTGLMSRPLNAILYTSQYGPLNHILDKHTSIEDDPDRALHSLPDGFVVKKSRFFDAGLGVFTKKRLPTKTVMGPYFGVRVGDDDKAIESGYSWAITKIDKRSGKEIGSHHIDAKYTSLSNWLRYVNTPVRKVEENLEAFQHGGGMYYRTVRPILPGEELLVWYGDKYGIFLGLDVGED